MKRRELTPTHSIRRFNMAQFASAGTVPSGNAYRTAALKIISNLNLSMPIQNYTRYKTDKHAALICFIKYEGIQVRIALQNKSRVVARKPRDAACFSYAQ